MTSPENFRRRQRIEGVFLVVLGLWVAFWTYHSSQVQGDIVDCVGRKVTALSDAAGRRADLSQRETAATKKVILGVQTATTKKQFAALLFDYQAEVQAIQRSRQKNPLPPFPPGACADNPDLGVNTGKD